MCRDRLLSPARSRPARHASEGCYGSRRWHEAGHGPRRSLQRRSRSACPRLARKHRDRNPQRDSSVTIYPLAGCLLLAEKVPGGAPNLDLAAVALVFSLCLVPIPTLNWAALTIAAFYVAAVTRDGSPLYRASLIALAITGPMAWGPELLNAVFEPFQVIDAQLVSLLVGAGQVGRSVEVVDGSTRIFIAPGCSSFHNISLALLGWVTATKFFFASQDGARNQLSWCLVACSGVLLINVTRIALIGLYPRYYDAIHGQPGEVIANLLSLGWIG